MNKKLLIGIGVAVVVLIGGYIVLSDGPSTPGGDAAEKTPVAVPDPRNGTYSFDGELVTLKNGEVLVQEETGSFTKYSYFQQADGLLNEDITDDSGVILVSDGGGSGTFYYAAALVSTPTGWTGTKAILLGDRIAPQTIDVSDDMFIVNYADRKPGESFAVQPSVGVTRYFQVRNGAFVEVTKDRKLK